MASSKIIKISPNILAEARKEALKGNVKRGKVSALALSPSMNRIICKIHNAKVMGHKNRWTLHAEERLLLRFRGKVPVMLVYRAKKDGPGNSKPCYKCMRLIEEASVKRIIFFQDGEWLIIS